MFKFFDGYNTYIGILISVVFKILAAKGLIHYTDADKDQAVTLIMAAISFAGDLWALIGRLRASKPGPLATP